MALPMTKQILPVYAENIEEQETKFRIEEGIKEAGFGTTVESSLTNDKTRLIQKHYEQFG